MHLFPLPEDGLLESMTLVVVFTITSPIPKIVRTFQASGTQQLLLEITEKRRREGERKSGRRKERRISRKVMS